MLYIFNILTCIAKEGNINIITDSYKPKRITDETCRERIIIYQSCEKKFQ